MDDFRWLWKSGPGFNISGDNVTVLHEPSEFYQHLKDLSDAANKRIVLASLYLGDGELEKNLVSHIHAAARRDVQVRILLDYTRGSRGESNSRTMLTPMLREFSRPSPASGPDSGELQGNQVQVALYHSPKLRGVLRWLLPQRWNETLGLTHLKVYLFDDTLVLSGANLSDQYFRNRQDRYVVFRDCSQLADYFASLVAAVSSFSLQLHPDDSVALGRDFPVHPYKGEWDSAEFVTAANERLAPLVRPNGLEPPQKSPGDTWVFPLLQMMPLGIRQDQDVTERILARPPPDCTMRLATGYFNLTQRYADLILGNTASKFDLLVASPKVNGFYGAEGLSGVIPTVYTLLLRQFFSRIGKSRVTFVLKKAMNATLMRFVREQQRLYDLSTPVTWATFQAPSRYVPLWVRLVTPWLRSLF
ncbi:hypothetical protein HPB47_002021 [Ixodes persulcatus]|uniref:Uncharacterized protein n=1 Tax=Ixodes persulcatus TaxID=34615 RepID=A0AC60PNX9_IXOPE|nr:hypothetical protein HPB47_002021 [Ixodes persulcatus]